MIGGYLENGTGNATAEWSSRGQGVGAALTLSWSTPQTVSQVVLYDRPNLSDQVIAGRLTFSDGSTVNVPTLNNDGSATIINFTTRTTTSVVFSVQQVSAATQNIGLSEIKFFGPYVSPSRSSFEPR